MMMTQVLMLIGSYLFGAIPAGYLAFRLGKKGDLREHGSGTTGATNTLRTAGWKIAVPVLLFDIFKGVLPVLLAAHWFQAVWLPPAAGLAAILGHCFPVYIGFRGGKGVATAIGCFLALAPSPLLCALGVFLLVVALTRIISLSSLAATASIPLFALLLGRSRETILLGLLVFVLVVIQHRENIGRLIAGNERRLGEKAT